jgi:phosphatidylserine/phosphatidylglycerophosphate/cardiolipin synthase-like enzyme
VAEVVADGRIDIAGVVDATQIEQVLQQWAENGNASWKTPSLRFILTHGHFTGKQSTPYAPGSVHDYMHAKVTVCDDFVFIGSFNLSHSGEQNAENVVEIRDASLADRMAAFIDEIRAKYPAVEL